MSPDGFRIYERAADHPGAYLSTCHSGVTLAANHALALAPAILDGELPGELQPCSARRLHVPPAA
jgi:octopine oxidase subunit B